MNKFIKFGAYGSVAGIAGILAKPVLAGAVTNVVGSVTALTKGCFAIGSVIGVPVSGGAVLGLITLYAVCSCVDLDSINYKKLLGWEEEIEQDNDVKEEIMCERLATILAEKMEKRAKEDK